jgi:D-psicose/D-tagatose/L-ribulose 3-epimerase
MNDAGPPGWEIALIDSAWHGSRYEGPGGLVRAREIGYEAVDLFVGFDPGQMNGEERAAFLQGVRDSGLPVLSVVCTCLGLNDFNPAVRQYHIDRACAVVDLAAEFDTARNLLFVPGEYMFQRRLLPPESEWERVVDATRRVGQRAAERKLEVAIELLPFEYAFVSTLDDLERLLDAVDLPNVKAAIDISHLWLQRIDPGELERFAGRVGQVHVADCDGENHGDLPPGRGTTPFPDYLEVLQRVGYRGSASVELEFPTDHQPVEDWVGEAYAATRRLLAEGGQRPDLLTTQG